MNSWSLVFCSVCINNPTVGCEIKILSIIRNKPLLCRLDDFSHACSKIQDWKLNENAVTVLNLSYINHILQTAYQVSCLIELQLSGLYWCNLGNYVTQYTNSTGPGCCCGSPVREGVMESFAACAGSDWRRVQTCWLDLVSYMIGWVTKMSNLTMKFCLIVTSPIMSKK